MKLPHLLFALPLSMVAILVVAAGVVLAQTPATQPAAVAQLPAGWEQIDQRMVFLTVQLASVETSLDAVDRQLRSSGYREKVSEQRAANMRHVNETMDRNMGMPAAIRWQEFYGRTAEKFFYHPTKNSLYMTTTILRQQAPANEVASAEGVPSRQGLPIAQRPPQFDYIYRANREAEAAANADADKLAGQVDKLFERRRELENEQSALWCKISFQAVAGRELLSTRLYRYELGASKSDQISLQRLKAMRAAMEFLRTIDRMIADAKDAVDSQQAGVYAALQKQTEAARARFQEQVIKLAAPVRDMNNTNTTFAKLCAVIKRMCDVAANASDSYKLAADGERNSDMKREFTFRASLQDSLVQYAAAALAGDECITTLAQEWDIVPDVAKPMALLPGPALVATVPPSTGTPAATRQKQAAFPSIGGVWQEAAGILITVDQTGGTWRATCSYTRPDAGKIHWVMVGTVTVGGAIEGTLLHTKAPAGWKKIQHRDGQLSADGRTISGTAKWDGGGEKFTWTNVTDVRGQ